MIAIVAPGTYLRMIQAMASMSRANARHVIGTDRSPAAIRNAAASGRPSRWALN